jgi:hypothetical protein
VAARPVRLKPSTHAANTQVNESRVIIVILRNTAPDRKFQIIILP